MLIGLMSLVELNPLFVIAKKIQNRE